jgi:hypothetical protein
MYGFSGFATNSYGTGRPSRGIGPAVEMAMAMLKSVYGISNLLMLKFRRTTLSDPSDNQTNTLEL